MTREVMQVCRVLRDSDLPLMTRALLLLLLPPLTLTPPLAMQTTMAMRTAMA